AVSFVPACGARGSSSARGGSPPPPPARASSFFGGGPPPPRTAPSSPRRAAPASLLRPAAALLQLRAQLQLVQGVVPHRLEPFGQGAEAFLARRVEPVAPLAAAAQEGVPLQPPPPLPGPGGEAFLARRVEPVAALAAVGQEGGLLQPAQVLRDRAERDVAQRAVDVA